MRRRRGGRGKMRKRGRGIEEGTKKEEEKKKEETS